MSQNTQWKTSGLQSFKHSQRVPSIFCNHFCISASASAIHFSLFFSSILRLRPRQLLVIIILFCDVFSSPHVSETTTDGLTTGQFRGFSFYLHFFFLCPFFFRTLFKNTLFDSFSMLIRTRQRFHSTHHVCNFLN